MKPESKLMCAIFGESSRSLEGDDLYHQEGLNDALMEALDSFASTAARKRYKRVILLRFGFESPDGRGRTLKEVASEFGVTPERIRQIEAKALRLLRHPSRARRLREFIKEVA